MIIIEDRNKIIEVIEEKKIVLIVRGVEREKLISLAEAMYKGGIRLLEVTYSANGKVSEEDTAENIHILPSILKINCISARVRF